METIKQLVHTRALNDRNEILSQYSVPTFQQLVDGNY